MRRILLIITFNIELLLYVSIGNLVLFVLIVLSILLYLVLDELD